MLRRRRRGTLAQELGKTIGGVLAATGSLVCCKAIIDPQPDSPTVWRSAYLAGSGDLFTPFPPEHLLALKWIGLVLAIGGSVVRLMSYWRITAPKEEQ